MIGALLAGLLLALCCYLGVEAVRRHALRRGMLDVPVARSSHSVPVPRGGGLVIVGAALAAGLLISALMGPAVPMLAWLVGGLAIALVGWLDDVRPLGSGTRLAVQLAAAMLVLASAGWWREFTVPLAGELSLGWAALPVALLWIVGLTNAYNFMDGIDGIAAGQAVVAGAAWAAIGAMVDAPQVAAIGGAIAFSSGAFLLHNWSPARIFMGDVGSAFLGFTFAALPFLAAGAREPTAERLRLPIAAALVVWAFVFDALFTFVRRALRGENLLEGHRSHLYQRLVLSGTSHRAVATLYVGMALAGALLGLAWLRGWPVAGPAIAIGIPAMFAILILSIRAREGRSDPSPPFSP